MESRITFSREQLQAMEACYVRLALEAVSRKAEVFRRPGPRSTWFKIGLVSLRGAMIALGVAAVGLAALLVLDAINEGVPGMARHLPLLGPFLGFLVFFGSMRWLFSAYGEKGPSPRYRAFVSRVAQRRWRRATGRPPLQVNYTLGDGTLRIAGPGGVTCRVSDVSTAFADGPVVFLLFTKPFVPTRALLLSSEEEARAWVGALSSSG